ncbi:MAG: hypothetical protein ACYCYF_09685 [Anaerolineae bacterium]
MTSQTHDDEHDLEPAGDEGFEGLEGEEFQEEEEFSEIIRYTGAGFVGGLALGAALDALGFQGSAVGQWLVRTLAGEGESILEGIFSLRKRLSGGAESMAQAYGFGKLAGMALPWVVDWGSRALGVDVNSAGGFYVPYFYALGDQIGANVSSTLYLRRREGSWSGAFKIYRRHPVLLTSLAVVLVVPMGLLAVRLGGFRPDTQVFTALETIAANLCWLPPLVGWLTERRKHRAKAGTAQ